MITVYKMGMSYYENKVDKNSGMTEVSIIAEELKNIKTSKNVLVIINGIRDEADNELLKCLKEKKYDLTIFIMSDSIALETSLDIMNECDYVLHQAPYHNFSEIKATQYYSYVPELFYKYCKELQQNGEIDIAKTSTDVYFGGNNKNRDDKFKAYKVSESPDIFARYKLYESGEDTRIGHNEYLREISKFAFSLVICREDYRSIGWLTSRYFEAIALDNIPFIDCDYDIHNFVVDEFSVLRVRNHESLMAAREFLLEHPLDAYCILSKLKRDAEERTGMFRSLIKDLIMTENNIRY